MRYAIALAALALVTGVQAQTQCVCTSGCKIASDPYPLTGGQPVSCNAYKMPGHTPLASGQVVDASSAAGGIAASNAGVCLPASPAYVYGPAGSKACLISIPAQASGTTVTLVMTATNAQGESADSTAATFQSVPTLPTVPSVPLNPRVTP